jgi:glycosyltransferase involved in cell wall biosynthesis
MQDKVSVVIATYNGERYIKEQLESILVQLDPDDEVIINDDCSKDGTCEIVKAFEDTRIILVENKEQQGVIRNFEKGLALASGNFIFLSDQDDVWFNNKVSTFKTYLSTADIVQSDAIVVSDSLEVLHPSFAALRGVRPGFFANLFKNNYMGCNMAFRREVLNIALPFPGYIPMHDLWIGIIGELFFTTKFISEKLLYYRRHSSNVSQSTSASRFGFFQKLKFRINVIRYLPLLYMRRYRKNHQQGKVL